MDFNKFVEWAFQALIIGVAAYGVNVLASVKNSIVDLDKSVNELNSKIATIIEKVTWHEKWLEKHDEEILNLRDK